MSDGAPPSQPSRPTGSRPALPSSPSSTTNPRVMSAARTAPLPKEQQQGAIGDRLKSEGANVALNALSVAKEMVQDFRQQDRFFKYKAFIVAGWVLVSAATVGITCGRGVKTMGEFGARLVMPQVGHASLTLINNSRSPWRKVVVLVTDDRGAEWQAYMKEINPGQDVTITPKQLLGSNGQAAPADIGIRGVQLDTSDGKARLMENGQNLTMEPAQ